MTGGTSAKDSETGRVATLQRTDFPQRSTLMKLSQLSTLWDYINRAMPWNAPKSLTTDEVYAVTAYILNLGEIVPTNSSEKVASATETIERLRLNIPKLQAGRAGVIDSFYDEPDFLSSLSDGEIDRLIDYYSLTDEKDRYQPYCQVIIYLLKQEIYYRS